MTAKPHPLKGRKLSAETLARRAATRLANAAVAKATVKPNAVAKATDHVANVKEALFYLNKAAHAAKAEGRRELSDIEVFVHLAKRALEGRIL